MYSIYRSASVVARSWNDSDDDAKGEAPHSPSLSQISSRLDDITDTNQLQTALASALNLEDYQLAAKIRDRLKQVISMHNTNSRCMCTMLLACNTVSRCKQIPCIQEVGWNVCVLPFSLAGTHPCIAHVPFAMGRLRSSCMQQPAV